MSPTTVNRIGLGIGLIALLFLAIVGILAGSTPPVWVMNVGIVLLGTAVGVMIGFLVSPYEDEEKNFSSYAKYLFALVTGYMASKLDGAIEAAVTAAAADQGAAFRILAFIISLLAALLITFVARRYPL